MEDQRKKKIVNNFLILVIVFVIILVVGFITLPKPKYAYHLSAEQALGCIMHDSDKVTPENAWQLINNEPDNYMLIDLRNTYDYRNGTIDHAQNMPYKDVLSDDYQLILNNDKTKLFFASNELRAVESCYLLKQLGYKNIKVIYGGYDYLANYTIKNKKPAQPEFPDDRKGF